MIKKLLGALALSLTCTVAGAAGGGYALERAPDRMNDMAALQNGAKLFVNYCLNCHSANSMRWRSASRRRTSASRAAARSADSWQWVPSSSLSNCATSSRLKPKR